MCNPFATTHTYLFQSLIKCISYTKKISYKEMVVVVDYSKKGFREKLSFLKYIV